MAKDSGRTKPKKKHWWNYLGDAYRITKRSYSWTPWALLAGFAIGLAVGIVPSILTGRWLSWMLIGIMLALLLPMITLTRLVRRASYAQIDGMPGAASAVLDNIKRGWDISTEPVRVNARTQDMVFRAIGRPGIVLIAEGPKGRVGKLIDEERRAIRRVAPNAPVHTIFIGHDDGQTELIDLEKSMRRLPKTISNEEVAALARRLEAIKTNTLPIPKGIDPMKARPDRRALRGK